LAYRTARSEEMTAIQATLIPIAKRFIEISRSGGPASLEDLVTEVTMHCRAFVSSNGTDSDANYYRLEARSRLVRINRAAVGARDAFEKNVRRDEVSREENAVVERVLRKEPVFCNDMSSEKLRKRYQLQKRERKYEAFLSVPVYSGSKIWGMLSVNSSKKKKLTVQHQGYMEAVAVLLAAIEDGQATHGPTTGGTSVAAAILGTEEG
jgi:transcriptional regulator with GAF, ATPase, and Fis domain